MKNHYEALCVPEDASEEMIRAAYKAAAKQHHPDRNSDSAESRRMMQAVNEAYAVLSDPVRRWDYDRVLAFNRSLEADSGDEFLDDDFDEDAPGGRRKPTERSLAGAFAMFHGLSRLHLGIALPALALAAWGVVSLTGRERPARSGSGATLVSNEAFPSSTQARYARPALSPVGTAWPSVADYVEGYPIEAVGGLSSVTIDNTLNTSDVYLKLVCHSESGAIPVRTCFIPARSLFTFSTVRSGRYEVRYRDLKTGLLAKSEPFDLTERSIGGRTEFSKFNIPLYQVALGGQAKPPFTDPEF